MTAITGAHEPFIRDLLHCISPKLHKKWLLRPNLGLNVNNREISLDI